MMNFRRDRAFPAKTALLEH